MDFYNIAERSNFHGRGNGRTLDSIDIYPDFLVTKSEDLMIKGRSFYAVWDEAKGMWSQEEFDVQRLVDADMYSYRDVLMKSTTVDCPVAVLSMKSSRSKTWKEFKQYVSLLPDNYHELDEKLTFLNSEVRKEDYVSKKLGYALEAGDYSAWETLVDKLYSKGEREKIEWAIGAIVSGDSKKIQKFCVFYGEAGSGKSTIINIIQRLFEGYYVTFDAKALGSASNQFATEAFRSNPLVAIQHDGDLSRIEDNTRINSIVSHEMMTIKEKFKPEYMSRANCFLFMGTNKPVKITDAKSGIIRRLIDIHPTGQRFSPKEYDALISQIDFQLGAIAQHCLEVYRELGKNYYKNYIPQDMIMKTDVFYNFVEAKCEEFERQCRVDGGVGLKQAYAMYKDYCDEAMLEYKLPMYKFREELKNYFERFDSVARIGPEQKQVRSCYTGFLKEKLEPPVLKREVHSLPLVLDSNESLLDICLADCPAQYAVERDGNEAPEKKWSDVTTTLKDIDTTKLHYVRPVVERDGMKLIMIDLDIRNENGEKDMLKNLEAASKFPKTYAEFSKGGAGIHLIYWYEGDVSKLSLIFAPGIEIKHFRGNAAMRRRLSKCNNVPIAVMAVGGLPLKEEKMIDILQLKDELHLRNIIKKCLKKKNHGATRPEVDLIRKVLDDAYASDMKYDVSDMQHDIFVFALNSTNQSDYCVKQLKFMKFKSEETEEEKAEREKNEKAVTKAESEADLVFFDVEVFPNLFLVNWKVAGEGAKVNRLINPSPIDIEELLKFRLVGFNCRKYDNHMLYGCYLGLSPADLYDLSRRIIVEQARDAFYPEAYDISYTDVYDFASKKQSLKKWEIELGIHHKELGLPWDQPVPEELWEQVAEYCDNDVIATEAVWNARKADFVAREILADIAGMSVNDTTNTLSTRIIFGGNRHPQNEFNYRFMGDESDACHSTDSLFADKRYTVFDSKGRPVFPGYKFELGESYYRGEKVGEGGYVYAEPGIYYDVALLDIASMHPSSIVAEDLFGPEYTQRFHDILNARIAIKHKDFNTARTILDGKLAPYLTDEGASKDLAGALKIVINSVYGLTSAKFDNPFRDRRNVDNIVAKRGALFMINLKHEIQDRGFTVIHCKTDSVKIANATPGIIQFVMDYGKLYGYNFEHEATYDRMCLVNDAVYIAKYKGGDHDGEWTATGAQFQQPVVFKTLFSGEPISFNDYCETKAVTGNGSIFLDMNENLRSQEDAEEERDRRRYNASHPDKIKKLNPGFIDISDDELDEIIASAHDYQFIGRVGLFFPIKPGRGGGELFREKDGKYYAVTGTKGYRWLEAETVKLLGKEEDLDPEYHDHLIEEAIAAINNYGDFDDFVGRRTIDIQSTDPVVPCGDGKYNSCLECPACEGDICNSGYSLAVNDMKGGDDR